MLDGSSSEMMVWGFSNLPVAGEQYGRNLIADSIVVGEPQAGAADGVSIAQAYLQEVLDESAVSAPPSDGRYLWIHGIGLDRDEPPFTSRLNQPDAAGDVAGVHVAIERDGTLYVCGRSVAVVGRERRVLA